MALATANWNYPTAIRFGAGRISELPEVCSGLGINSPLLVTDRGLAKLPILAAAHAANEGAGLPTATFCEVDSNPTETNIRAGVEVYRSGRHDGVIAFGGGSAIDAGKVIALMAGQTRPLWDFEDVEDWWTRADPAGIAPVVAVPTTAGTGSEVGRAGVILEESTRAKKIIFHPELLPKVVILDPELTIDLPPSVTAATGMDALSHALEAYCAAGYHPMADGIAVEAIRLIAEFLPRATEDGHDIEARGNMLVAAAMGATAFQKGLGGMHALAHPIGGRFNTHHGLTNAVLMPFVLSYNRPAIESRIARLAAYLELPECSFEAFMQWLLQLRNRLNIPATLQDIGVDPESVAEISKQAAEDPSAFGNPVPFNEEAAKAVMFEALGGRVAGAGN